MPKHKEELILNLSLDDSWEVCREGIASIGWATQGQGDGYLVCKEVSDPAPWLSGHWAVQVEISLASDSSGRTYVALNGSNRGWGPIQSNHVRDQVSKLRSQIESIASQRKTSGRSQSHASMASELEKLGQLHTQGILTNEEFRNAKSRLLNGYAD